MLTFLRRYLPQLLLVTIALILVSKLLHPGWYASHDGIFHIYRTEEALSMLKLGQLPLRWAGNFDQGFGIPLFTFIYPLPYYLSAILSTVLGPMWALKTLTITAYMIGGIGMYTLLRSHGRAIALFGSLLYLLTPYQFLNIFVRGTIGETMAIGLIPWVLYSYVHLRQSKYILKWYHPIPLALLLLAHNFLGLLFTAFLLGYILTTQKLSARALGSLLLSFGLAAFFIIPMIVQKNLLYSFEYQDLTFRYDQHFVTLSQLLYGKWDYWYSVMGDGDGMSFQLGLSQLISASLGIGFILLKNRTFSSLYLVFAYIFSIYLMHSKSYFVWESLPLLQAVQFPWRFLFMPLVLTPLLASHAMRLIRSKKIRYSLMLALLLLALVNVRNYRSPMKFFDNVEYTDLYRLYYNKTSTTFRTEILPKWGSPPERYKNDEILVNSGNMTIDSVTSNPLSIITTIHNKPDSSEGRLTILRNYYPGWSVTVDGKDRLEITPTPDGMISLKPILGIHSYEIKIKNTTLEKYSNVLTLVSLIILGYLWYTSKKSQA